MAVLNLIIPGIPQSKQSARFRIVKGNKPFIMSYQKAEVKNNERSIKMIIKEQLPEGFQIARDAVKINKLHYIFPPLSSFSKKVIELMRQGEIIPKTTKPDLDSNLNKGLMDSLEGIIFVNDSQICELNNVKKYYGFEPKTEIEIEV